MQHGKRIFLTSFNFFRYFINMMEKTTTWDDPRNDPKYKYKPIQIPMQVSLFKMFKIRRLLIVENLFQSHCMDLQKMSKSTQHNTVTPSRLFKAILDSLFP